MLYNIESFCPLRKIVFKHENILFTLEINLIFPCNRAVFSIHVGLFDAYICVLFIIISKLGPVVSKALSLNDGYVKNIKQVCMLYKKIS